jgi:hypothetical protein
MNKRWQKLQNERPFLARMVQGCQLLKSPGYTSVRFFFVFLRVSECNRDGSTVWNASRFAEDYSIGVKKSQ